MLKSLLLISGLSLGLAAQAQVVDISEQYKAGQHVGEKKQLDVDVNFSNSFGVTNTDAQGITYNFWGISIHEDKIYPPRYWGSFPLYFFGQQVKATVTVTNNGPRQKEKLRIITQVYVLNTDGSSGVKLAPDKVVEFWVDKGQTQVIDASFIPEFVPGADSGLDKVVILVEHPNEGGEGPGNDYPALIMVKEAVLCPPPVQEKAKAAK